MCNMAGKEYEKVPPEGGWGYLVGIGFAITFITILGPAPAFGLIFGDFLTNLGEGTNAIALVISSCYCALSFSGLFASILFKKISMRSVGVAGGVLYFIASVLTIFVTSIPQLVFTFVIQGISFGFIISTSFSTFNFYFVERRVLMMSISQAIIGLGNMVYPVLIEKLLTTYGFRGCLAVLAAINAHGILGMLVMHPVEWHMKKVPVQVGNLEGKTSSEDSKHNLNDNMEATTDNEEKDNGGQNLLDRMSNTPKRLSIISKSSLSDRGSADPIRIRKDEDKLSLHRAASIQSLGNWTGSVVITDNVEYDKRQNRKWQIFVDFLDLTLLKDVIYVNIIMGLSFIMFSDITFFAFQPSYLFALDYSKENTAIIIAVGATADLVSRIFLALSSICIKVKARYLTLTAVLLTIIARFAFLHIFDFIGMAIITAILSSLRPWIYVTLPLILGEYLPPKRFSAGYGLFVFLQGNMMIAIGPIVGYIRDITQSYEVAFYCLIFFLALCAVPWIIEIIYLKYKTMSRQETGVKN